MGKGLGWLGNARVRLGILLAVLASLTAYAATTTVGVLGLGGDGEATAACPTADSPVVATVPRDELRTLREAARAVVSFDDGLRPYQYGLVSAAGSAWIDEEPGTLARLPVSGPAGYEMRWWMENRDDVVADALLFRGEDAAREFLELASGTECRTAAHASAAAYPPGARNLEWRNPFGFTQQDVLLRRGRRVYRVSVVQAGLGGLSSAAWRRAGFSLVDGLACLLPGAACAPDVDAIQS